MGSTLGVARDGVGSLSVKTGLAGWKRNPTSMEGKDDGSMVAKSLEVIARRLVVGRDEL